MTQYMVVQLMLLVVQLKLMCVSVRIKLTQSSLAGVGTELGNKE